MRKSEKTQKGSRGKWYSFFCEFVAIRDHFPVDRHLFHRFPSDLSARGETWSTEKSSFPSIKERLLHLLLLSQSFIESHLSDIVNFVSIVDIKEETKRYIVRFEIKTYFWFNLIFSDLYFYKYCYKILLLVITMSLIIRKSGEKKDSF